MNLIYHTSIAVLVMTLSACDRIPSMPNIPSIPAPRMDNNRLPSGVEVQQANALLRAGQRKEAAQAYFSAAKKYRSPDRERLILQAAELASLISDNSLTQSYLSTLGNRRLNPQNDARYRYIQGQMAISDANYVAALRLLPKNVKRLPEGLKRKILNARLSSAQLNGNTLVLATELVLQEPHLKQRHEVKLNHDRVWSQVSRLTESELNRARTQVRHPIMRGWLDLGFLVRISESDPVQLNRNIKKWQRNFSRHPANPQAAKMIRKIAVPIEPIVRRQPPVRTPSRTTRPVVNPRPIPAPVVNPKPLFPNRVTPPALPKTIRRVAAILPLSGSLGGVGQSLLSGIKKAQKDYASDIEVKTYDSNVGDIGSIYQKAVNSGVDFIIGPFSKTKIAQLSRVSALPVNTLSLNYIEQARLPTGLYQFGLLPEDESIQVAQKMLAKGYRNVAIIAPDSSWGRRLRDSFGTVYTRGGGNVRITINYANRNTNYSGVSKALTKKKASLEAIFLAASPTQAQGIQTVLRKNNLKPLPVFATSHIYSGINNSYKNVSLEGIRYTEIPWILEVVKMGLPQNAQYPRLRALGMDALMVARGLPKLRGGAVLNGRTGQIKVKRNGTLHRKLKWAKFNGGSPLPLSQ